MAFGWFRPTPQKLREKAERALATQDFPKAIQLYKEALYRTSDEVVRAELRAHLERAQTLLARSRYTRPRWWAAWRE